MIPILKELKEIGIIPVVKIDDAKDAVPLAGALIRGGLPCAEITFRTAAAKESIRAIKKAYPDMLVGAGTVLNAQMVDDAIEAGAEFIVSPGLNPTTVKYCQEKNIPIVPGVATAGEVEIALSMGLETLKFFPAEANGGVPTMKALAGPFPNLTFIPTGGINAGNLKNYLDFPKILACGGSWMVDSKLIASGDFDKIEELVRQAVEQMLGFEFAHVGINCGDTAEAEATADSICSLFGFAKDVRTNSIFAGPGMEIMKAPGNGTMGHIAIRTNYIDRAVAYLKRKGVALDMEHAKYKADGKLNMVYIKEEMGGFAFHLVQK